MLLTRSNKVLGIASISKGGINGTVTDVRIVLQYAIKEGDDDVEMNFIEANYYFEDSDNNIP